MNKLIYDEKQIEKFLNLISLQNEELYLATLFTRNKHISKEDRERLDLPRSHTLGHTTSDTVRGLIKNLYRWETNPNGFLTKTGDSIPNEALNMYMSINPVSPLKAYPEFNRIVTEYLLELSHAPKKQNIIDRIKKMDKLMLTCMHHAYTRKVFIDVDIDSKDKYNEHLLKFEKELTDKGVKFKVVETHGGLHYLLECSSIKYNYNTTIDSLKQEWEGYDDIMINPNNQLPLPGTLQYGTFEVKLLDSVEELKK